VKHIRSLPNLDEFLLPRKCASLCSAAISGPVVIVNAHTTWCDALILCPHSCQVYHVALPGLQASAVRELQLQLVALLRSINAIYRDYALYNEDDSEGSWSGNSIELSDMLGQLWLHLVEPILCYLGVSYLIPLNICALTIMRVVATKARDWQGASHYMVPNWSPHLSPYTCTCCWPFTTSCNADISIMIDNHQT
jgi:hypothetical protein